MMNLEKFYKLEEPLQDAILAEKTALTVYNLGEQNGLDEDGIGVIGELTRRVLMRELAIKDFATEVELKTGLSMEKALAVAEIIERDVFTPVKIYIMRKEEPQEIIKKEETDTFVKHKDIFDDNL